MPDSGIGQKLEQLLESSVAEMASEEYATLPVVADYVLLVALDDASDPDRGGIFMASRPNTPMYRTLGLLREGERMVMMHGRQP